MQRELSSAAVCMILWFLLSGYDPVALLEALDANAWCLTLPVLCRQRFCACSGWHLVTQCLELEVIYEGALIVPGVAM